jgi:hypothetical protein
MRPFEKGHPRLRSKLAVAEAPPDHADWSDDHRRPLPGAAITDKRPARPIEQSIVLAAERYWLLRYGDEELRFSLRSSAERWAAQLEAVGIDCALSRHDESTEPSAQTAPCAA